MGKMVQDRVVRLRRAAGPNDAQRMTAKERGELFARIGHGPLRPRAELVHAGRVAADFLDYNASSQASRASRITGAVAL